MTNEDAEETSAGGGVGFWTQTRLLIEKNWKCKLRANKKKLAGEILLPVFYLLLLSFLVKTQPNTKYPEQRKENSDPINVFNGLRATIGFNAERFIGVVPRSNETEKICIQMNTIWGTNNMPKLQFQFFDSVQELESDHSTNENGSGLAIIFSDTNPKSFNYTIMTENTPSTSQKTIGLEVCRRSDYQKELESPTSCPVNGYFYSGFLGLQYLLDQAVLKLSSGSQQPKVPDVEMQNYPQLEYNGEMSPLMRAIIPLYSVIPMAQLINSLLVLIVTEKEDRIKDGFRMTGVSDGAYWLSWFAVYSTIIGILSVLFTLVMHLTSILRNINVFLLFLIFFLFGLSVITFAFALTPFFHKPKTAGVVGTLIMQFCGMLFMVQTFVKASTDAFLVPLRLISSLAFTTALDEACAYEFNGGITFSDLMPGRRGARILYSLIFICFDTVFYGIIAVYLDNVIPNEYGARKHPLFCFTSPFWKTRSSVDGYRVRLRTSLNGTVPDICADDPNVEGVPTSMNRNLAITIRNIFKTYTSLFGSNKVEAVKGISLDIYEGQITAILGKNGAGKSTLFSIITGLVPPTKGKCNVFGMDTSDPNDMDRLRKITGVCLQTNLLFPPLTAEEHLQLYGKLRGLQGVALNNEVEVILEELKLTEKANVAAANLSGGQKRKLSVGIALIGDPKIILLDEPSAGVDPVSRRHLWSLLKRKKEGRVILLATHFLDEADFLADRKAIIHNGVLKCYGSSLFLKNRFGVGYHLTVETEGNSPSEQCDSIIQKWTPDALISKKVIGKEIKYCLPNSQVHIFANLFNEMEQLIASANSAFKSYGVSMTTLEEVFLKISNDAWEDKSVVGNSSVEIEPIAENTECNLIPDLTEIKINIPESLWVLALLRIRRLIRSPQSLFFLVVMPLVLVAAGLALMRTQDYTTRELMPLDDPKSLYSDDNQLRLAVGKDLSSDLEQFMRDKGFQVNNQYSGQFPDLLNHEFSDLGTMAALSSKSTSRILRINGTFLHSPPLVLNAFSQFYLKQYSGNTASLSANVKLFPAKKTAFDSSAFYAVFLIGPSFTLPAVGMVMELVKDREISARNHLRVNGVSFGLYFSSVFVVFGFLSFIITISQIALIYAFALPAFLNPYALTVTTVLLLLFIIPCLLVSTLFSYLFDRLESAQSIFSPISSWMGTIVGVVIIVMDGLSGVARSNQVLIAHGFFSALDIFYIPFGIFYWINKQYMVCTLADKCEELSFSTYLGPEIVIMAICLVVQVPIFLLLIVIADVLKHGGNPWSAVLSIFKKGDLNSSRIHNLNEDSNHDGSTETVDEDVLSEKARVANVLGGIEAFDDSVVLVHNLKKTYKPNSSIKDRCRNKTREGHKALNGINFTVEKGEVFGLLGHNGAGKTTAMRIIIAEESPDSGIVRLCGTDIESNYSDAFLKLGYCAQHDPLWENIKLREHLELYAVIRGIPRDKRNRIIDQFLTGLQIGEHANKKAHQLSGGTKRKLSYGISMLGAPKVVLLDEPSTGMDPQSKRFLWNTILGSFKESRGAILTTHSMEEAEILCSRIAILAKGSLICIGSPQHLKSKYGSGYVLEIKLKSTAEGTNDTGEDKYAFVKEHFPDCKINEIFDDKAVFSLSTASVPSLSRTFSLLEELKQQYNIEEYSFSQTTLEQIFLYFAKDNDEDESES